MKYNIPNITGVIPGTSNPNPNTNVEWVQSRKPSGRRGSVWRLWSHQTLNKAHLLGHGQGRDGVVQEHRQEFGVQPLLTSAVAAAAATVARRSTNNGGLGQSQHSERRMDGEDRPEKSPESIKYTHVNVFFCGGRPKLDLDQWHRHSKGGCIGGRSKKWTYKTVRGLIQRLCYSQERLRCQQQWSDSFVEAHSPTQTSNIKNKKSLN